MGRKYIPPIRQRPCLLTAVRSIFLCSMVVMAATNTAMAQSTFSAERLVAAATQHLQQQAGSSAEIQYTGSITDQEFSQTGVRASIKESRLGSGSYQNVVVEFALQGKTIRQLSLPFRISRMFSVPVAVTDLPAGTILTRDNIVVEQRSPQSVRTSNLLSIEDIVGKKLKTSVSATEALTADKLTIPGGIMRGQVVRVIARAGNIVVSTTAKALADALPGEQVSVVRTGAGALLQATVLGDGIVEVE